MHACMHVCDRTVLETVTSHLNVCYTGKKVIPDFDNFSHFFYQATGQLR